jgi:hypothetical protein
VSPSVSGGQAVIVHRPCLSNAADGLAKANGLLMSFENVSIFSEMDSVAFSHSEEIVQPASITGSCRYATGEGESPLHICLLLQKK